MRHLLLASLVSLSFSAQAFIKPVHKYIHTPTGRVIDASEYNFHGDEVEFFDYAESKKKRVKAADLSKATRARLAGVKAGEFILVPFPEGPRACEVWVLFENAMAQIGCQTGEVMRQIGPSRPAIGTYILSHAERAIGEVAELDGRKKKDHVVLSEAQGKLKAGESVRIEAIFANGQVLVQRAGLALLDTSSPLHKFNTTLVNLSDLK